VYEDRDDASRSGSRPPTVPLPLHEEEAYVPRPPHTFKRLAPRLTHRPEFLRAVAGTAGANVLITAFGSLTGILLARELGPALRGDLAVVTVWPVFLSSLLSLGLPQAVGYRISTKPEEALAVVSTVTLGSLALSLVMGLAGASLAPALGKDAQVTGALVRLLIVLPVFTTPVIWIASLQPGHVREWNIARTVQPLAYLLIVLALSFADGVSVNSAVNALITSLFLQAAVAACLVRWKLGMPARPRWAIFWPTFRYGMSTALAGAPMLVNFRLDQLVLSVTVSSAALGSYAVAVSLSVLASPVSLAFGYIAFPTVASTRTTEEQNQVARTALIGAALTAAAITFPLAALSPWFVPLFFGEGFDEVVTLLWIMAPAAVVLILNQVSEEILRGKGRPLAPAIAEGVGAVATVALLLILVPSFGTTGAAIASLVSYFFVGVILRIQLAKAEK
jgi:O-antigen/teichoic acid export membrane protein